MSLRHPVHTQELSWYLLIRELVGKRALGWEGGCVLVRDVSSCVCKRLAMTHTQEIAIHTLAKRRLFLCVRDLSSCGVSYKETCKRGPVQVSL